MLEICIVPGHATMNGEDPRNGKDWHLEAYQQDGGHHLMCFLTHIMAGIAWLMSNPYGRLVFSGGFTRPGCQRSEAASYLLAARRCGFIHDESIASRIILEENARDSMENVLFGVAAGFAATRFRISRVVVINFRFKQRRYGDHFNWLNIGHETTMDYFGINDPLEPQLSAALFSEEATRAAFASTSPDALRLLREKRQRRTWAGRVAPDASLCREWPELSAKLNEWNTANP
jgi:hypothetical protein